MVLPAETIWRDFTTDGVPSSGAWKPKKSEIREQQKWLEGAVNAGLSNGGLIYASKALMDADLAHGANSSAWVIGDTTTANNGIYRKSGASGSGSWSRVADLPYSFVRLSDVGAGTANAIQVTSSLPTSVSVLRVANVFEANTGNVTIAENGGAARSLRTNSGNQIAAGGLTAGMMIAYVDDGVNFRLLSDQVSAAIVAAAEAAQAAAEDARDATLAALSSVVSPKATRALAIADTPSADPEYYDIAYFDTNYQAGSGAKYRKRASDPGTPDAFQNGNGTWYSIDTWIKTPQMFGVCGAGGDDSAVFAALNDPDLVGPIFVPAGTYIMEDVTVRRWMNGEGPGKTVIKHKANSSTVAFQLASDDPLLSNLTVDGDKSNQTGYPTLVTGSGGKFTVENVNFENSVYAGIHLLDFVTANFRGCTWTGMAYHGGTTGQQTMCAVIESSDKALAIFEGCKFINLGSPSLSAPGGVLATHKNVSMIFKGNYFYRIGQGEASNFIGCIDAYQEGVDNIVVGNIFGEICYAAAKLSSSKHNIVADNIINGFDSGDSTAVPAIVIAFRPTDQITQKVVVKGNVIGGTIGAGKSGIEVYGASGSNIQNVTIEGNVVKTPGRCIMVQYADVVKILNNDVYSSADANPVRTLNLANALVDIRGNTITCGAAGIPIDLTSADGSSGAIATIADNTIVSLVSWSVALRLDGIARARMSGNTFNGFGTSTARLYNIAGNIVAIGNLTDGNTTLDTTGSGGDIIDVGNTWNAA